MPSVIGDGFDERPFYILFALFFFWWNLDDCGLNFECSRNRFTFSRRSFMLSERKDHLAADKGSPNDYGQIMNVGFKKCAVLRALKGSKVSHHVVIKLGMHCNSAMPESLLLSASFDMRVLLRVMKDVDPLLDHTMNLVEPSVGLIAVYCRLRDLGSDPTRDSP